MSEVNDEEISDEAQAHSVVDEGGADRPVAAPSAISIVEAKRAIEAMVLVATDPLAEHLLAQLIEIPVAMVRELCHELAASYTHEHRGFQLVEVANGWRFQTHPDLSPYIERYVLEGQTTRLSTAALETLAIVAYKQPISRAQVSAIRGVNVDGVLRTLVQRGYLGEVGRDDGPGQAVLFGTTSAFLEKLGIASIELLPPLGDFVPGAHVVEALEQTLRVDRSVAVASHNPQPRSEVEGLDDDVESGGPTRTSLVETDAYE